MIVRLSESQTLRTLGYAEAQMKSQSDAPWLCQIIPCDVGRLSCPTCVREKKACMNEMIIQAMRDDEGSHCGLRLACAHSVTIRALGRHVEHGTSWTVSTTDGEAEFRVRQFVSEAHPPSTSFSLRTLRASVESHDARVPPCSDVRYVHSERVNEGSANAPRWPDVGLVIRKFWTWRACTALPPQDAACGSWRAASPWAGEL
ncbi:hypothetical protein BKA63DRAFT_298872 [Paraphoma chrysanthemicola]|nr:hypothetical protein BKA63DRAFT_298872 [Paraphoma chrysanthemicola]